MTQVDFYVMTGGDIEASIKVACRLVEKASQRGQVYVKTRDEAQTSALQEKLWSFREDAFVPHSVFSHSESGGEELAEKVCIGHSEPPIYIEDILINLSLDIPNGYARFERLLEVVPAEHGAREICRKNYVFYRDRGYPLKKHDIDP